MAELIFFLVHAGILLSANILMLRLIPPLFGLTRLSWLSSISVVLAATVTAIASVVAIVWIVGTIGGPWFAVLLAIALLIPLSVLSVIWVVLRVKFREALWDCGIVGLATLASLSILGATIPFVIKGYSMPFNSMSPTIKGPHLLGVCPDCGGKTIISLQRGRPGDEPLPYSKGVCSNCRKAQPAKQVGDDLQVEDRFFVRRLATAQRWDIVAYRQPENRNSIHLHRLIGLPGESVHIRDGAIWIDGKRQAPPHELASYRWVYDESGPEFTLPKFACDRPLQLAPDECFILGDNSTMAYDSRFVGPVPWNDITGVAWLVYFPPRDWRVLPRHD